jgi:hypothetical protein
VRKYESAGAAGERRFEITYIHVEGRNVHIDEDGNESVLQDGIDGRRESRSQSDDLIAGAQAAILVWAK